MGTPTDCAKPNCLSRNAQFALQHTRKNFLPAFLLLGHRLVGFKPLFQAQTRRWFGETQNAPAVRELEQEHFDAAFHVGNLILKTKLFQHFVEAGWRRCAVACVSRPGRRLKITFIQFHYRSMRILGRYSCGFQNFMVERNRQLFFIHLAQRR